MGKKKARIVPVVIITVIITLLVSIAGNYLFLKVNDLRLIKYKDFEVATKIANRYGKLYTIQEKINNEFLWETDEETQMDAMYKALVASLGDKYSEYMTPKEAKKYIEYVTGTFSGVGIIMAQNDNKEVRALKVVEGGPADLAGVKDGDVILKVDGKKYKDVASFSEKLKGEEGTEITLTFKRGKKLHTVKMVRGTVEIPSVSSTIIDKHYGYISIGSFEKTTSDQFKTELASMENNDQIKGIVIDLRQNTGGIFDEGIAVADSLLPECTITETVTNVNKKQVYTSDTECTRLKYVVLVDGNSASTTEVVAAAIKDNRGGKIVGTKTFGKGIIQTTKTFTDSSALKLTTMEYLSPKGNHIHKKGVTPDYIVKLNQKDRVDRQLKKALDLLK